MPQSTPPLARDRYERALAGYRRHISQCHSPLLRLPVIVMSVPLQVTAVTYPALPIARSVLTAVPIMSIMRA